MLLCPALSQSERYWTRASIRNLKYPSLANFSVPEHADESHRKKAEADQSRVNASIKPLPRTVNGTGHTDPSEFCATSI